MNTNRYITYIQTTTQRATNTTRESAVTKYMIQRARALIKKQCSKKASRDLSKTRKEETEVKKKKKVHTKKKVGFTLTKRGSSQQGTASTKVVNRIQSILILIGAWGGLGREADNHRERWMMRAWYIVKKHRT